ncbi:hypothetical protein [uncultured Tateyamaria sp.]|uniref:MGH1-like glycoside hydrolase domain-containing protein n=1 Tax=uncultured Tateyamaria sp. TaxID=455651 RepID=UPI003438C236
MRTRLDEVMALSKYGVPSLTPDDARFDGKRYWRGPVWAIMNLMISEGLMDFGLPQGTALRANTADLIAEHGFAEYFDPRDGAPAGGSTFTWTAAVWLAWASPNTEGA